MVGVEEDVRGVGDEGFEGVGGPAVDFDGVGGAAEGEEVVGEGVAAGYVEWVGPDGQH